MYNTKVSKENNKKIKALVVIDGHLIVTPDGKVWSQRIYDYNFFKRYLDVFDSIRVVSRIKESDNNDNYPNLCSGDNVEFFGIDDFRGPKQYITKYFTINSKIKRAFNNCDCAIFRIPSTTGYLFMNKFKKNKLPYSIEVVVDPWDSFSNDKAFYIQIIRRIWTKRLKKACLQANVVSYVTKNALQNRYPSFAKIYGEDENHILHASSTAIHSMNSNQDYNVSFDFPGSQIAYFGSRYIKIIIRDENEKVILFEKSCTISKIGKDYKINPIKDLIPVCPNCHAMLHRQNPPFEPDQLKKILDEVRKT